MRILLKESKYKYGWGLIMLFTALLLLNIGFYSHAAAQGAASNNIGGHSYGWNWAEVPSSYLEYVNGEYIRVEVIGNNLVVENYNSNYELQSSKNISMELPIFGGFYNGQSAFYVMYGQENPSESDDVEVVRIVKYDKSWNRLGSVSYNGINTKVPFDAGSSSFAEYGNRLYVRTCHKMYKSSKDGLNHQANMTFVIDTDNMTSKNAYYIVSNAWDSAGYTSHSFNQYIRVAGNRVLSVDHGDAHPRSIVLQDFGTVAGGDSLGAGPVNLIEIPGEIGDNYTGTMVGGFETSAGNSLTAISRVQYDGNFKNNSVKNVSVLVLGLGETNASAVREVTYTSFTEDGSTTAGNPYLVKISDDRFVLMWELYNKSTSGWYYYGVSTGKYQVVIIDGNGNAVSAVRTYDGYLSGCQPISVNEKIVWYVTGEENNEYGYTYYEDSGAYFCELNVNELYPNEKVKAFVTRLYEVALNREPEAEGLADWTNRLQTGEVAAVNVVQGVLCSDEYKNKGKSNGEIVNDCYQAMLGRGADESGYNDWVAKLDSGMSVNAIFAGFVGSEEFGNLCASYGINPGTYELTEARDMNAGTTQFVSRLYTQALGRSFDADGLNDWCGQINANPSRDNILNISTNGFLNSQEFQNKGLDNTEYVKVLYRTYLGREYDDAGLSDWVGQLDRGEKDRNAVAAGFAYSAEFSNIMAQYGL